MIARRHTEFTPPKSMKSIQKQQKSRSRQTRASSITSIFPSPVLYLSLLSRHQRLLNLKVLSSPVSSPPFAASFLAKRFYSLPYPSFGRLQSSSKLDVRSQCFPIQHDQRRCAPWFPNLACPNVWPLPRGPGLVNPLQSQDKILLLEILGLHVYVTKYQRGGEWLPPILLLLF